MLEISINYMYSFMFAGLDFKYNSARTSNAYNRYTGAWVNRTLYFGSGLDKFIAREDFGAFYASPYTLSGTIFHEFTHIGFGTQDATVNGTQAYSRASCLALDDVDKLRNANNWRYAYEDIFSK